LQELLCADASGRLIAVSEKPVIIANAMVSNFIFIVVSPFKSCRKDK
jgi:hypothetical protein